MARLTDRQKIVIVGAGPVGSLAALYAANRGDEVHIYELRADLRDPSTTPLNFTRSINLALSERGINSIRSANHNELLNQILRETIPMHARMIHGQMQDGSLIEESQAYDAHGRYIAAADRGGLNKHLLDALEKMPNVTFHFNHKLTGADFNRKIAWFEQRSPTKNAYAWTAIPNFPEQQIHKRPPEIEVDFDLLIGADGAHSATRYHMMKYSRVNYQQEYIDTLWCEFQIPAKKNSGTKFAIDPNHLHIWPAGSFMFIAIPSLDGSFTCTLFAPSAHFEDIATDPTKKLRQYFSRFFPGVCPNLISYPELQRQFQENPHLPLISIKCRPYHYKSSAVILGDAAHAMVPFYGQGMNAGLEDVRVLFDMLDAHNVHSQNGKPSNPHWQERAREAALDAYTAQRAPDATTINDLALKNYEEMRSGVRSPLYKLRKWTEETVMLRFPFLGWRTQYTRISFENQRYSEVERDIIHQGRLLLGVFAFGLFLVGWMVLLCALMVGRWVRDVREGVTQSE